ncbi:hypothetical protein SD074_26880 [Prolixibacter sp. SD074]|nr:hypothetical protein SD074_26880 [Prolixibacter sp. SD074]
MLILQEIKINNNTTAMKSIIRLILSVFFLFAGWLHAQETEKPHLIDQLTNHLKNYRLQTVNQEVYVSTDKSLYRPGEDLWFKGYVTDVLTHLPSLKSLELDVRLISDKGDEIKSDRFKLQNGITNGDFKLPEAVVQGNYYLIAYTPEMTYRPVSQIFHKRIIIKRPEQQNLHYDMVFDKPFYQPGENVTAKLLISDLRQKPEANVKIKYSAHTGDNTLASGKVKTEKNGSALVSFNAPKNQLETPLMVDVEFNENKEDYHFSNHVPLANDQLTIHFFPEGGNLVPASAQMVALRASDAFGNPTDVSGNVVDHSGKLLAKAGTVAPGLGIFSLVSRNDNQLKLVVTSEPSKGQEFSLPQPDPKAVSITASQNNADTLWVTIKRPTGSEKNTYSMLAVDHGDMAWASEFKIGAAGRIPVNLNIFRQGVTLLSVFDEAGNLRGQRLVNINKGKSVKVNAEFSGSLGTDQDGKIHVKLTDENGNPVKGEIAVSVTDTHANIHEACGISLLNCGTSLPIPLPNPESEKNAARFKFYLMANHLQNFNWDVVRSFKDSASETPAELNIGISGMVFDHKDQPVAKAKVNVVNTSMQVFTTASDENGHFTIDSPLLSNPNNLTINATDDSGKKNLTVKLDKSFAEKVADYICSKPKYDPWKTEMNLLQTAYFETNPDLFASVPDKKLDALNNKRKDDFWRAYLDQSTNLLDIINMIKPFDLMGERIVFKGSHNSLLNQGGALIVIDGQQLGTSASTLSAIPPMSVEDIHVSTKLSDMAKYTGLNSVGVIEITTKKGKRIGPEKDKGPEYDNGFRVSRKFSPQPIGKSKYNLETTLLWAPVVFTNEKGEAHLNFKTSNLKSTYNVHIEGITLDGTWFSKDGQLKVE